MQQTHLPLIPGPPLHIVLPPHTHHSHSPRRNIHLPSILPLPLSKAFGLHLESVLVDLGVFLARSLVFCLAIRFVAGFLGLRFCCVSDTAVEEMA